MNSESSLPTPQRLLFFISYSYSHTHTLAQISTRLWLPFQLPRLALSLSISTCPFRLFPFLSLISLKSSNSHSTESSVCCSALHPPPLLPPKSGRCCDDQNQTFKADRPECSGLRTISLVVLACLHGNTSIMCVYNGWNGSRARAEACQRDQSQISRGFLGKIQT